MTFDQEFAGSQQVDAPEEIERLVMRAARLSQEDTGPSEFYRQLLELTVQATSALGGAVWLCDANGRFFLEYQIQLDGTGLVENEGAKAAHARVLQSTLESGELTSLLPRSGQIGNHQVENPSEILLTVCPLKLGEQSLGVLEIFQHGQTHPSAQRGAERIVSTMCGFAIDFQRNQKLDESRMWAAVREDEARFARAVHRSLEQKRTAFVIANEGRRLLGCDRLSLIGWERAVATMLAVSGVDTMDRRSNAVRCLEQLARVTAASGDAIWYEGAATPLPPQIDQLLQPHLDEQHVRSLVAWPLVVGSEADDEPSDIVGVLVAESFSAESRPDFKTRLESVGQHAALALHNTRVGSRSLLGRLSAYFAKSGRALAAVAAILAIAAAALILIPADLDIVARGELQPLDRHDVFAPEDGEIVKVHVKHDAPIAVGDKLVELYSPELDGEFQRVEGEKQTTRKRIEALESARVTRGGDKDSEPLLAGRMAAEEIELQALLASHEKQLEILRKQRAGLLLISPIDGRVTTWDVDQLLDGRPTRRGQVLLTIADTEGPWVLRLQIPDDKIRHVLQAHEKSAHDQAVTFILASNPSVHHSGTVREIAGSVTTDSLNEPHVRMTVDIDAAKLPQRKAGTNVIARIKCGRRSLGYVWTHEVIETIQTWLFF